MEMGACLNVNGERIGPGVRKGLDVLLRVLDHEVDVERGLVLVGHGAEGTHHVGTNGQVGDEVTVHHVDVQPLGAGAECLVGTGRVPPGVGRDDGGGKRGHIDRWGHGRGASAGRNVA